MSRTSRRPEQKPRKTIRHEYSSIYMIRNKVNGKVYIGRSVNPGGRIRSHILALRKGEGYRKLQKDFNKYGEPSFESRVLKTHKIDERDPREVEEEYILKYDSMTNGYNERYPLPKGAKQLGATVTNEQYEKVNKIASKENKSVSLWLKQIIVKEIDRHDTTSKHGLK